ncbi:hypothetical protein GGQ61_003597 [Phenylobacterium haematophilum]|uniref:Uncharacterized protein n=1 Tax=Phenylobacterium haematophilum TaxID=98513 RepID=A0A840A4F0_9CAUL|nr:hypothetical protein [Phenylobacterium haematophilum]MBB3892859.1 hypothetical protein [Phenylobacterium haematophilum]
MSTSPTADADPSDTETLRTFQVVAAQEMPFYCSFTVEAADPDAALARAKAMLLAEAGMLTEREPEGAHSLRIVALQEDDQDPIFADVSLDPDAPLWPGPAFRTAVLATSSALAALIISLGEAESYPAELDRLAANLRLLHLDCEGAAALAAARRTEAPDAWVDKVLEWAWAQMDGGAR